MSQIATLYIVPKNTLQDGDLAVAAIEKIDYNWSGYAFVVLSVFSDEIRSFDWQTLELHSVSLLLSEKTGRSVVLFSANDRQQILSALDPNEISADELENFAMEFSGDEGLGEPASEAIKLLISSIAKLEDDTVLVLEIG